MFISDLERDLLTKKPMSSHLSNIKIDTTFIKTLEDNPSILSTILKENKLNISWFLFRFSYKLKNKKYESYLIDLLSHSDTYIQFKSCEILTSIYTSNTPSKEYLVFINKYLINSFCYMEINQILTFIIKMINNLKNERIKEEYLNDKSFLNLVSSFIMRRELQYNALVIVWILSFGKTIDVFNKFNLIGLLPKIIQERNKEKVLRVSFALLASLYRTGHKYNAALSNDLIKKINHCLQHTLDKEFIEDLSEVKERIETQQNDSYTLSSYFNELFYNALDETKIHFDLLFWERNSEEISVKKVEIIKALRMYLISKEIKHVWLAANDINMMLKVIPGTYFYVEKYKVKDELFRLCTHESSDVKYYAVQALSSCILAEWK